ncbi:MAG: lytic transglycosylase domain-containing protein [Ruminococcaceae bacterium]|nr:lytic transglycosylase domain-containing protein [Oscillospiraceae bacterium]
MNHACARRVAASCLLIGFILLFLLFLGDRIALSRRERAVLAHVASAAAEFDVPPAMVLAVIRAESEFRPDAVSKAGARGLMQLMPDTFSWLCEQHLKEAHAPQQIDDPAINIRYGTYYLSYLYQQFGSWRVALAAYNAGEGRVTEWLADPALAKGGTLRRIPFPETAAYVKQTLEYYAEYLNEINFEGE